MKKSFYIITAAALSLVACSRNQEINIPDANLSLFARTESPAETKTVVESGVHVYWEPGDEIAVFMGEQSAKFTTDITATSGTATFKGTFGDATWPEDLNLWAVYPFSEEAVFDGETITTTLPSEQVAREGSFGKDMNLAIARSNSSTLQFYNVGGGIRFSVTEEGIKKVMFEGLSGEIISGKVKIGMDENGKPEVREVTSGSQFITLLPPDGQDTFAKDTWYYIIAIPGSLEGGYKLRFYKDTDYARKVSDKKVEIKRSIFGNIEKADSEIEYEALTMHFPETREEWVKSVDLTHQINGTIRSLLDSSMVSIKNQNILSAIQNIEGVLSVSMASDTSSVTYLQRDSVWCNYLIKTQKDFLFSSEEDDGDLNTQFLLPRKPSQTASENSTQPKNVFIYIPFQWSFSKPIGTWIDNLSKRIGEENIVIRGKDIDNDPNDGDVFELKNQLSKHYDLIILDTHGCIGSTEESSDSDAGETLLATSTVYSAEIVEELHKNGITNTQFGNASDDDGVTYVCISPDFLDNNRYDHSAVILSACESSSLIDFTESDDNGSMIGAFINRGATLVTGADVSMSSKALSVFVSKLIELMVSGFSFQDAFDVLKTEGGRLDNWLKYLFAYNKKHHPFKMRHNTFIGYDIVNNYIIKCNEKNPEPFFLFGVNPALNSPDLEGESIALSWDCELSDFIIQWPSQVERHIRDWEIKEDVIYDSINYSIFYDVYIGGERVFHNERQKNISYPLSYGKFTWSVDAKILEEDSVFATYRSEEGHFTITAGGIDDIPGHDI